MKQFILLTAVFFLFSNKGYTQKYYTKNGSVSFYSKTNMEDIKADNNQVVSVLNIPTSELQFSLLIKNFHFPKALMEEHFNEDYLESDKYPKANFKGTIEDISKIDFSKDGNYPVTVNGSLTVHGITNKVGSKGVISIKEGKITGTSVFIIALAEYNVTIPKLVKDNISKTVEIKVNCLYNQKM